MFQCFFEKMHSRTPTNEQEHCDFFLKICTRKRRQIRPDGTQMSKKSWFGGVLEPCGGVLEPSGPENPPGCILGCENHVRGSPLGDAFWYNSGVFLCFFLLSFRPCAQDGILLIFMRFLVYFRLHFLSFLEQGRSSFFATLPSETMIFKVPGLLFFSVFFQCFPQSIPDLIFPVFLVISRSPRLPFWSLWACFSDIKKESNFYASSDPHQWDLAVWYGWGGFM